MTNRRTAPLARFKGSDVVLCQRRDATPICWQHSAMGQDASEPVARSESTDNRAKSAGRRRKQSASARRQPSAWCLLCERRVRLSRNLLIPHQWYRSTAPCPGGEQSPGWLPVSASSAIPTALSNGHPVPNWMRTDILRRLTPVIEESRRQRAAAVREKHERATGLRPKDLDRSKGAPSPTEQFDALKSPIRVQGPNRSRHFWPEIRSRAEEGKGG